MSPLPSIQQIADVRYFIMTYSYNFGAIARLTGVPLRDVFRIARAMIRETAPQK